MNKKINKKHLQGEQWEEEQQGDQREDKQVHQKGIISINIKHRKKETIKEKENTDKITKHNRERYRDI